jgi:hypothetical protein
LIAAIISDTFWFWSTNTQAQATPTVLRHPTKIIEMPKDQSTCLAAGGKWGLVGLGLRDQCNLPTSDAGTICSDSSECESLCLAALSKADQERITREKVNLQTKGKCAPWRIVVGCIAPVENGQVKGILCID